MCFSILGWFSLSNTRLVTLDCVYLAALVIEHLSCSGKITDSPRNPRSAWGDGSFEMPTETGVQESQSSMWPIVGHEWQRGCLCICRPADQRDKPWTEINTSESKVHKVSSPQWDVGLHPLINCLCLCCWSRYYNGVLYQLFTVSVLFKDFGHGRTMCPAIKCWVHQFLKQVSILFHCGDTDDWSLDNIMSWKTFMSSQWLKFQLVLPQTDRQLFGIFSIN